MNGYYKFLILGLVLLVGFGMNSNRQVFGHTFSGDESASFLATVEMIKIESQLAADQLPNATLAKEHVDHMTEHLTANDTKEIKERNERVATELNNSLADFANTIESGSASESDAKDKVSNLNDVLADVVNARIDQQQINNVTVKALVVNDLVGEGLEHYGSALGMKEESETEDSHSENKSSESHSAENGGNQSANIVDEADYQSAQAAVSRAIDLFDEIKTNNSTELGQSLTSLKEKIDSKSPFDEIDQTVDDKISPMLNDIFKLDLSEEEHHGEEGEQAEDDGHEDNESSAQNETHESEAEG
jgi:hypothetical protein